MRMKEDTMKSNFHPIKKGNGLYEARYWAKYSTGIKERKSIYGRDLAKLKKEWQKCSANSILQQSEKTGGITTAEYLKDWLQRECVIKESTRRSYEIIINAHIISRIGNKPVSEIDSYVLQRLVNDLIIPGKSTRTAQQVKWIMSKALRKARKLGLTTRVIDTRDIEVPITKPKEVDVWSVDDVKRFLEVIQGDRYEFFYLLYVFCGLRRGEAIPLEWSDIDWENKTISINKQYCRVRGTHEVSTPKTDGSVRILPMPPRVYEYLSDLRTKSDCKGLIVKENGKMVVPSTVSHHFQIIARDNNLPRVVLHSLRHFAATALKDAGVSVKDCQSILGHSTPLTTMKYYQHSDIDSKREAINKLSNFMDFQPKLV